MSEEATATLYGACLCGQVRFEAQGQPLRLGLCHCLDCRQHHGAPFLAAAISSDQQVAISGDTASRKGRHVRQRCGSSVLARTGDAIKRPPGALDEPVRFTPTFELWTIRREPPRPAVPGVSPQRRDRHD